MISAFFSNVISTPVIYSGSSVFSRTYCGDGESCCAAAALLLPGHVFVRLPALPVHQVRLNIQNLLNAVFIEQFKDHLKVLEIPPHCSNQVFL